jgi:hypothetical protein
LQMRRFCLVVRVFSGVYSCPFGQWVLLRCAWFCRVVFSLAVTGSRCSGLQQSRLRHRWSSWRFLGMGLLWACSHVIRCITRSLWPGPRDHLPYPLRVCGPFHVQHPLVMSTWRWKRANSALLSMYRGSGTPLILAT